MASLDVVLKVFLLLVEPGSKTIVLACAASVNVGIVWLCIFLRDALPPAEDFESHQKPFLHT